MIEKIVVLCLLAVFLILLAVSGFQKNENQPLASSDSFSALVLPVIEPEPADKLEVLAPSEPEKETSQPEVKQEIIHETQSLKANEFYYYSVFELNGVTYYPGEMTREEQLHTYKMCEKYGLEYETVLALFGAESRWKRDVVSAFGCIGYGQIKYSVHKETLKKKGLDVNDSLDNIEFACYLLAYNMSVYGDYKKALMAYRFGNEGANQYFKKGIYENGYVRQIMAFREGLLQARGKKDDLNIRVFDENTGKKTDGNRKIR